MPCWRVPARSRIHSRNAVVAVCRSANCWPARKLRLAKCTPFSTFPFVLGRPRSVGADQEPVVLRLAAIGFAQHRVVQVGFEHRRLQVVDDEGGCGAPPNHSNACRWHANQVLIFWSKTGSAY